MSRAESDSAVERVRRGLALRKEQAAARMEPSLQKAASALDRARAKHGQARRWPRIFRFLRRNQEAVDEALLGALEGVLSEVERLTLRAASLEERCRELETFRAARPECQGDSFGALALEVPLPDSDALWTVEVRVNPRFLQNRYRCYLEEAPFGSFSGTESGGVHAFRCRPLGRALRVVIIPNRVHGGGEAPVVEGAVLEVRAISPDGACLPLYGREGRMP